MPNSADVVTRVGWDGSQVVQGTKETAGVIKGFKGQTEGILGSIGSGFTGAIGRMSAAVRGLAAVAAVTREGFEFNQAMGDAEGGGSRMCWRSSRG
ncbi:hypothetical protein [Verrucomicrobium spinosum]|uniref:hypothetical protein n=1 Tax=Verrucomicrobium spinosum TaxID=2736 RepID=UPI0001746890|nr:hypothetical protein [Verrucomicrobium spinosum]